MLRCYSSTTFNLTFASLRTQIRYLLSLKAHSSAESVARKWVHVPPSPCTYCDIDDGVIGTSICLLKRYMWP